ncbi:Crp/Fnr family transcriptional regulator [Robertkochia flava]|uniref:Crp/Fnr family transcriptional regulator n=1 Tax=Robertkochia flava TaxID=3447986 RepID=UPI001CCB020F|nr:Crp/Fnr family transcriptional regulator [Robertkochia marina]
MLDRERSTGFIGALNNIHTLSTESTEQLLSITDEVFLEKQELLLPFGKACRHIYFVNRGFVRIYYLKNGKEVTEWFADKGEFCFSIESYFTNQPSSLAIETIEESQIFKIPREDISRLIGSNLEIANLFIAMFSGSLVLSQQRMSSIQFETARERYEHLEKHHPNIILKAPLQHIASFLGITSETLSRIRSSRI